MANWLLISAIALLPVAAAVSQDTPACESLALEVLTENSADGARVIVTCAEGTRKEHLVLHLFTNGGEKNRLNLKATAITGLKPGKYVLVIVDKTSRYCPMKVDIEITP